MRRAVLAVPCKGTAANPPEEPAIISPSQTPSPAAALHPHLHPHPHPRHTLTPPLPPPESLSATRMRLYSFRKAESSKLEGKATAWSYCREGGGRGGGAGGGEGASFEPAGTTRAKRQGPGAQATPHDSSCRVGAACWAPGLPARPGWQSAAGPHLVPGAADQHQVALAGGGELQDVRVQHQGLDVAVLRSGRRGGAGRAGRMGQQEGREDGHGVHGMGACTVGGPAGTHACMQHVSSSRQGGQTASGHSSAYSSPGPHQTCSAGPRSCSRGTQSAAGARRQALGRQAWWVVTWRASAAPSLVAKIEFG